MNLIRVGVTGGRDYADAGKACYVLDRCYSVIQDRFYLVVGCARGLDFYCRTWAAATLKPDRYSIFYADWKQFGRSAGIRRNEKMAQFGLDLLIAFPGGVGTSHMKTYTMKLAETSLQKTKLLEIE